MAKKYTDQELQELAKAAGETLVAAKKGDKAGAEALKRKLATMANNRGKPA